MANGKVLSAIVEIAGTVSPTLGKAVGDVTKKLNKVNLKALAVTAAAAAGAVAVGKAAIDAGKDLIDLGSKFDEATDSIRIGTGATGDALDALMNDFDAVYSSVPTSMEDASKAIADYNTRLGLTGEELQGVSAQAIQVADMLGEDLGGVIESSSKAFQQWNIDAADMGGAMDYVFKASQSTGVGFSELMETVQSFGPQLQEMGYSFEEATALIGQLEKAGVNTEEVLGAMKKSTAALAKEGIGASKGLDMYADAIMNARDMTQATAIASEVFGTRAASTMAAALRDGSISVDQLTQSLLESEETISGCASDTYDYAEQLQLLKQKAQLALKPLANTMFDALNKIMPAVQSGIERAIPVIVKVVEKASPLVDDIVTGLAAALENLWPKIESAAGWLVTLGQDGLAFVKNNMDWLIPVVGGLTAAFVAYKAIASAVAIYEGIKTAALASGTTVTGLASAATWVLNGALAVLTSPITLVVAAIAGLVAAGIALYKNWDTVKEYAAKLGEFLSGIWDSISTAVSGFLTGIKDGFVNAFSSLVGIIKSPINAVIGIINGAIEGINNIGFDIPDWVPVIGGKKFALDIPLIPQLAEGGFTDGISIAGEAGMEAVISFDPAHREENVGYWKQAGRLLGVINEAESGAKETPQLAQAGRLMELDDFSLGQLTESTIIYYDFSGLSYAPKVSAASASDKEDIMVALKEQASEFFDWLEEWLRQKEVGDYDRVGIY